MGNWNGVSKKHKRCWLQTGLVMSPSVRFPLVVMWYITKTRKGLSIQRFGRGSLQVKVIPGHGADGSRARDALGWTDDILYQWNKMECFESYCHTWTDEVSLLSLKGWTHWGISNSFTWKEENHFSFVSQCIYHCSKDEEIEKKYYLIKLGI